MNVLLIYPEFPVTHWNFKHVLKLIKKRATEPPLGLLTIASMLPSGWNRKLVDLNVKRLRTRDLKWADLVFLSGMSLQRRSFDAIVDRCKTLGVTTVAGGPMLTERPEAFTEVDHLILNEAELTLPPFLRDLEKGRSQKIYRSDRFPDLTETPLPDWSLINLKDYVTMDLQYSRGCPYNCEFCSITVLFGHKPRIKSPSQFLKELDSLYEAGWRSSVFIVDDNFIGNKRILKTEFLPDLIRWQESHFYPFSFNTEVSLDLCDDEELMDLMIQAGFNACFIGIETPDEEGLIECGKNQNRGRDLLASVKLLHQKGFHVSAGFIVGFDSDDEGTFQRQFDFIQRSGIVNAMVGLLNAPFGTRLYKRLNEEGRLDCGSSGNNFDGTINFRPVMKREDLIENYKKLVKNIYSPENYLKRITAYLKQYRSSAVCFSKKRISSAIVFKIITFLGLYQSKGKLMFWRLMKTVMKKYPEKIEIAVTLAVYGLHFRLVAEAL